LIEVFDGGPTCLAVRFLVVFKSSTGSTQLMSSFRFPIVPAHVRFISRALVLLAAVSLGATSARAQELPRPRPSQHGVVSQEVALTTITVTYDRPVARGRTLYGGIVEWDMVKTPGANRATWVEFSTPVKLEGVDVPAGRYGVWHIAHESAPWEVILVKEWDTHHSTFPATSEALRVRVRPETGAHMETLAFYFPVVGDYETTLRMHWGTTILPLRIEVPR
jgi:hypothetical protein